MLLVWLCILNFKRGRKQERNNPNTSTSSNHHAWFERSVSVLLCKSKLYIRSCVFSKCYKWLFLLDTHPKQNHIHFKLGNPATNAASHSEAKRDGAKRVWPLTTITEPSLWLKCERFWESVLIMTDGIVTKREEGLKKQQSRDKIENLLLWSYNGHTQKPKVYKWLKKSRPTFFENWYPPMERSLSEIILAFIGTTGYILQNRDVLFPLGN